MAFRSGQMTDLRSGICLVKAELGNYFISVAIWQCLFPHAAPIALFIPLPAFCFLERDWPETQWWWECFQSQSRQPLCFCPMPFCLDLLLLSEVFGENIQPQCDVKVYCT